MLAGERWRHDRKGATEEKLVREESCAVAVRLSDGIGIVQPFTLAVG